MIYENHKLLRWDLRFQRLLKSPMRTVNARFGNPVNIDWKEGFIESAPWPIFVKECLRELPSEFFSSYSLDAEAAYYLIEYARNEEITDILECGSGVSTIILALLTDASTLSVEENAEWRNRTVKCLGLLGLKNSARVIHAPLSLNATVGTEIVCSYALEKIPDDFRAGMLLIDGPSRDEGRLGTLPTLHRFAKQGATVFLDDDQRKRAQNYIES